MQDQKKVVFFLGIGILIFVGVISGLFFLFTQVKNTEKKMVIPEYVQSSTTKESSSSTSEESKEVVVKDAELSEFLKDYFTWELTEESINERAALLQGKLSSDCYTALGIESERIEMIKMIQKYNETKEINTSNSTQLLSSRYITSTIYQDTANSSKYYVQVKLDQKAPYQQTSNPIDKAYRIIVIDGEIIQLQETILK